LHVIRNSPAHYASVLSIEDLDRFLQSEQLPAAFVNVVSHGTLHPDEQWSQLKEAARGQVRVAIPERLFALYVKGATLILNQVHHGLPSLSRLCRTLTGQLGFPARANIYISPPSAQGFSRHSDDHEILILQISGRKTFLLYPEGNAMEQADLGPGDLLYLPRGLAHEAKSAAAPSVHISLGLKPRYAFHLLEELAALARKHPDFQNLVPTSSANPQAKRAFEEDFVGRLVSMLRVTLPETLDTWGSPSSQTKSQIMGWPRRLSNLLQIDELSPDSIVGTQEGVLFALEEKGKELHLTFGDHLLTFPAFLKTSLHRVLSGTPVVIRDIPGMMPAAGKVEFVRTLVTVGLLSTQ
jgi:uncharacterized RmlC-like cupin family protein